MATQSPRPAAGVPDVVEVFTPARLHLGFLDLNGGLGRRFGSLGLTLDEIGTRLRLERGERPAAVGPSAERAAACLAALRDRLGAPNAVRLTLCEAIPEHIGLGSGTQLSLAVAAGLAALAGRPTPARSLAPLVERGARSGIGIGAFDAGGFLVDGGKGSTDAPAPIVARVAFPASWRIVLIFDRARRGLSGAQETAAFRKLPAFPAGLAAHLCRVALMRLLPGLAEEDFRAVGESIGEIQDRVGDHFAPAQGGRYSSSRVAAVLHWLRGAGFEGVGQSSWGPTGFVLVASEEQARALADEMTKRFGGDGELSFRICSGRNRGAEIRTSCGAGLSARQPSAGEGTALKSAGRRR
jgi:beta-RFAP synthase